MFVLDANTAYKLVVKELDSAQARALIAAAARQGDTIVAPLLIRYETSNIILKYARRNRLTFAEASNVWSAFERLPIEVLPVELSARALVLALRHKLPAAYDAHYLALAERLGCDFWTADERLVNTLNGALPGVRWLGSVAIA